MHHIHDTDTMKMILHAEVTKEHRTCAMISLHHTNSPGDESPIYNLLEGNYWHESKSSITSAREKNHYICGQHDPQSHRCKGLFPVKVSNSHRCGNGSKMKDVGHVTSQTTFLFYLFYWSFSEISQDYALNSFLLKKLALNNINWFNPSTS